ncbi:MAG: outer membrane protein assembly factor BamA [Bacteroidales bacterium]|nr:outer membrane protein assembly factor BamA [Candidatus Sodaliphilus aphodohippi]
MRHKSILLIATLILGFLNGNAQETTSANDTIYNPKVVFTGSPSKYQIAGIRVEGVDNYEDNIIIGYSGLTIGQRIEIPGDELKAAAKRFWRQGLFSRIKIKVDKICHDQAWLAFELSQQPRISKVNYVGMKGNEKKELQERMGIVAGNQMTPNIANRIKQIVEKYYAGKGFEKAVCTVKQTEDLSNKNEVIVDIIADKNEKIKVHKIYIEGNEVLSDRKIKRTFKKTNEKSDLLKLFSQKKFVRSDYKDDLQRLIDKYNEKGYRDATIVADSVVNYDDKTVDVHITVNEGKKYYINSINWVGNTVYPTSLLDNVLGIEKGDVYNQKLLNKRTQEDEDAIANLYMNNGYLFYQLIPVESKVEGDSIDLEMRMFEGKQARINKVVINGNDRLYEKVVRRELRIRPGELFSKSDLVRSAREIAQSGHFDPEKMDIRPEPNEENGTVDIILNLESKANDQIEFSAGWGQTGILGKLSLKFTNFSLKNLFHPSSYKGIIPQGDGQTFNISVQTNAKYYQAYSLSFLDPWFGGKRPNSLSISAFYSRQTGINSSYYNSQYSNYLNNYYMNNMYGGYGSYYGYNNYYNGYGNTYYENAYDPSKYLQMAGVTVGFGKRLKWPDDYFTLTADLSYQVYSLKNWEYLYYMNNGTSNSIVLGFTLARNSIDNPLYTRKGSSFSLSFHATPPASLFGKKNWKLLSETNTDAAKKELYHWIEYWKLKFQARTYTPLNNSERWTVVLMTRADIGLLGSWNKHLRSPFETFYVGGDGMSGSYTYATETIALRGYENGAFTPYGYDGYAYDRFVAELHVPLMLSTSATIYPLLFVEAGNAWTSVKNFNPFDMKRSAGAGVRIFLPMVGMMGLDWGYGFDKVFGKKGGSNFHFILGQEF